MKRLLLLILVYIFSLHSFSQKTSVKNTFVNTLNQFTINILATKNDTKKELINDSLIYALMKHLEDPESFNQKYDNLEYITVLHSDDGKLNVFTWNLFFETGKFKYFGFLQYKNKGKISVYFLRDKKFSYDEEEDDVELIKSLRFLTHDEWFGAIYYQLITKKYQSVTYYTLLGWDGATHKINRKVMEVLYFGRRDLPVFGTKMFKKDKTTRGRMIFEFSEKTSMMLRYNPKIDMIVSDHLAPNEDKLNGFSQFYGPDYSYDAFIFQGGKWIYQPNLDANYAIPYEKNKHVNSIKKRNFSKGF